VTRVVEGLAMRVVDGLALSALDELELRLFDEPVLDAVDVAKVVELNVAADDGEFVLLEDTALLYGDGKIVTV